MTQALRRKFQASRGVSLFGTITNFILIFFPYGAMPFVCITRYSLSIIFIQKF